MNRQAIILRGISGAGKSTLAATRWPGAEVVCSDDYYQGTPTRQDVHRAHAVCLDRWCRLVSGGQSPIVLDRMNLTWGAVRPFAAIAKARGYAVLVVTLHADLEEAAARGVHGVDMAAQAELSSRMEDTATWPPWLELEEVRPT